MPRRMQIEFSAIVQAWADSSETELSSAQIWSLFEATYLHAHTQSPVLRYQGHRLFDSEQGQGVEPALARCRRTVQAKQRHGQRSYRCRG